MFPFFKFTFWYDCGDYMIPIASCMADIIRKGECLTQLAERDGYAALFLVSQPCRQQPPLTSVGKSGPSQH